MEDEGHIYSLLNHVFRDTKNMYISPVKSACRHLIAVPGERHIATESHVAAKFYRRVGPINGSFERSRIHLERKNFLTDTTDRLRAAFL